MLTYLWFFVCIIGLISISRLHFLSVEHIKLQKKYGKEKGTKIGEVYGIISGWGFFLFWIGIWVSPQDIFIISFLQDLSISFKSNEVSITIVHLIFSVPFFSLGCWFGIGGVKETTLKVAETHRTNRVVTKGVYSIVRHPQYLGGLMSHLGMSFLFSGLFSLISTPLIVLIVYFISRKEERELIKEFKEEYEKYVKTVPMFIPRLTDKESD